MNLDAIAGKERSLVIKPLLESGEAWDFGSMVVNGELRDERDEEKVGEVECGVTENGEIIAVFPAMPLGQYVFVIEGSGEMGVTERLLNGMIGYQVPESRVEAPIETPERCLCVYVDGERRRALWSWVTEGEKLYESVKDLVEEAMPKLEEATELLQWAKKLTDSFTEAIRNCIQVIDNYLYIGGVNTGHYLRGEDGITPHIGADGYWYLGEKRLIKAHGEDGLTPYITSNGYWAIGDKVTNVKAQGKDGIDGTAVRRILVDSYADIPQSGPTCNGGYYYYVLKTDIAPATGWIRIDAAPHKLNTITINGTVIRVDRDYAGHELWVQLINEANCGVIAWEDGNYIRMQAVEPGEVGNNIAFSTDLIGAVSGSTLSGGMGIEGSYDVYAWVEHKGGVGRWVRVDLAYDIATTDIYGLTKLGSDMVYDNGAPVATNSAGQMVVPPSDLATPGTGKLSTDEVLNETVSAPVGFSAGKAYYVPPATMDVAGSIRYSMSRTAEVPCIGEMADGRAGARWATLDEGGCIKLGSRYGQRNPLPYLVGIGATENHELANNYIFGGALQHRNPDGWRGTMAWLDREIEQNPQYFSDMFYSGIMHTNQFTQTNNGLELMEAEENKLAGVYIATGMLDTRECAVTTASTTLSYLHEHYYTKDVLYTKQETKDYVAEALKPYATLVWAQETFYNKAQVDGLLEGKVNGHNFQDLYVLSRSERDALSVVNKKGVYLCYSEVD